MQLATSKTSLQKIDLGKGGKNFLNIYEQPQNSRRQFHTENQKGPTVQNLVTRDLCILGVEH